MNWRTGPYASLLGGVLEDNDPRTVVSLPELLQPRVLDQVLLKLYGADLMASQRPVLVSQWSKFYLMNWLPAMLVSQLAHGWDLPLLLREVGMLLDPKGRPIGLRFLDAGEEGEAQASLEPWIASNLRPFIEALSRYGPVPAAVLWGNAGDYLEGTLRRLQALGLENVGPAQSLLESVKLADGRHNPLYAPVRYLGDGRRQRRVCCLSYQVEWVGHCEHCPRV